MQDVTRSSIATEMRFMCFAYIWHSELDSVTEIERIRVQGAPVSFGEISVIYPCSNSAHLYTNDQSVRR